MMKLFKNPFRDLDKEGRMMLNTICEFGMIVGFLAASFLLIAYFIIL